jgi:excisionase family DNA binding protein
MTAAPLLMSFVSSEDDAQLAREAKQALLQRLSSISPLDSRPPVSQPESPIRLPAPAAHLLIQILEEMSQGNEVKLIPVQAEITTQEAAELLHVSRPTLIRLLNEGKIEFHMVGTHRRIPLKTALAFRRKIVEERKAALAELAAYDQELGI